MAEDMKNLTARIVAAYVENHRLEPAQVPELIGSTYKALSTIADPQVEPHAPPDAAAIRRSITPTGLISFEDGKRYQTLKRHLAKHGLTPQQYRDKWGLPGGYPLVAPNFSKARSEQARRTGLGSRPAKALSRAPGAAES
jgi:predicted transcriptional regulator